MKGKINTLVLSFGGNKKNTKICFEKAELLIQKQLGSITQLSSIYQTKAWGFTDKTSDFLNQIIVVETKLKPIEVLSITQNIEKKLGRKTKSKDNQYQDREIDIDILFYANEIIEESNLVIPHPLIEKRNFILEPLAEIIPDFIHPIAKKSIKKLLLQCKDSLTVENIQKKKKMDQKLIVIEGNIGSGKTTLCKKLAQDYQANLILEEFEENPFLKDFLHNQKNNPLGVELQFLIDRFHQLKTEFNNNKLTIADYFIEKSLIFSSNNLSKIEKQLFDSYYSVLFEKTTNPDLLVYLSVDTERILGNIKKRGRKIEQDLSANYLESIHKTYLEYLKNIKTYPVLILEVSDIDFVKKPLDYEKVKSLVLKEYPLGIHTVKL